jgi:hypothetical protein
VGNLKVGNYFKEQRRMLPLESDIKKELKGTGRLKGYLKSTFGSDCVCEDNH